MSVGLYILFNQRGFKYTEHKPFGRCAAEAAFLSYTAESSHHLMAAIIPKEAPCQEENI
jgi:hypothetical protein